MADRSQHWATTATTSYAAAVIQTNSFTNQNEILPVGNPGDSEQPGGNGGAERKLVLKLRRVQNETFQSQDSNREYWTGFESPPPYRPSQQSTSPSRPALLPQRAAESFDRDVSSPGKTPYTELQISGKIRIPVSPEKLFRAVPLFREFHYKESDVAQEATINSTRSNEPQRDAEASNEISVVHKSAVLATQHALKETGAQQHNTFNIMRPVSGAVLPAHGDAGKPQLEHKLHAANPSLVDGKNHQVSQQGFHVRGSVHAGVVPHQTRRVSIIRLAELKKKKKVWITCTIIGELYMSPLSRQQCLYHLGQPLPEL